MSSIGVDNSGPVPVAVKRIPELDGLRGVAIIMVISFHYMYNQLISPPGMLERAIAKISSFVWVEVDLFFVLSGFLIGGIQLRTKMSKNFSVHSTSGDWFVSCPIIIC